MLQKSNDICLPPLSSSFDTFYEQYIEWFQPNKRTVNCIGYPQDMTLERKEQAFMKGAGRMPLGGLGRNGRYSSDDDWEAAEELSPDPFSEEEHTRIHGRRFSRMQRDKYIKNRQNPQNQEKSEDIPK